MKLKEIYKENLGRKYRNVIDTKGNNVQINSSPIKIFKEHKYPIITGILLVILLILLAFRNNLDIFLVVLAFLAFFVGLSIYFNNYKIECKKDILCLKWNLQKFELPYTHLKSIFLSKELNTLEILPVVSYNIIIRYIDNLNFIRELSFPAALLQPEEISNFLDNFIIEEEEAEDCVKFEKYKRIKNILKLIGYSIVVILIVIAVVFYFFYK